MSQIDDFFLKQEEPVKSCLLALKTVIREIDPAIELTLRYGMPFFILNGKRFCYLWIHKKTPATVYRFCRWKSDDTSGFTAGRPNTNENFAD